MNFKVQPWQHQLTAIQRAERLPWYALFFEMGAGKTMTAINILRAKMNAEKRVFRTIVFAPPIVLPNWREEFLRHSNISPDLITILNQGGEKRLKLFQENAYKDGLPVPHFFITNYESLTMGGRVEKQGARSTYIPGPLFRAMLEWAPEAVVPDECHRVKSYSAQRSKNLEKLTNPKGAPRPTVLLLSGSPVLNSPMDLFQQFKIMDGGKNFGHNFFVFRGRYFEDKNAGMLKNKATAQRYFPKWAIKTGAEEEISKIVSQNGMRVTKLECMDLPDETLTTIKVGMAPQQAKNYKEMKNDLIAFLGSNVATAQLAIVKALRLMQITSGFLSLDGDGSEQDPENVVYQKTPKEEALRELLEELTPGSKVLVWAVWRENYKTIRKICEDLGVGYVEVHGGISRSKQSEAVEKFNNDSSVRVWIGHPGSGGIGVNLVGKPGTPDRCAYSIYYSRTFSLEQWLQSRARNHRGGQTEKVTHYDLVCEQTIDEAVQVKLANKLDMSNNILTNLSQVLRGEP
jgi:SNF2 family DNA or RNA helicase